MKQILSSLLLFMLSIGMYAQNEVTKFLGIPVDGTKTAMIQKLKAKGFTYDSASDCLNGEFNGTNVILKVVTNNNKVYRIVLVDLFGSDEANIKVRYNTLYSQFKNNKKYIAYPDNEKEFLSDEDNISYEMLVNKKRYDATFYQLPETKSPEMSADDMTEISVMKQVWFMIRENVGQYYIVMFYDNNYNQANGDDL